VQAVLFDLWETLITDTPDVQRPRQLWRTANVRAVFEAAGLSTDADEIEQALHATTHAISLQHDSGVDTDAQGRVQVLLAQLQRRGGSTAPQHTHAALEQAICTMPEDLYPHCMEGAAETLTALRARGLKTGLISNAGITTAPSLRIMLGHYELLPLLDVLVFSDEHRLAKPSLGIFEHALNALGCEAAESVFVGDSPVHDVLGARAARMRAVVIGSKQVDGIEPDARIQRLSELPAVLAAFDATTSHLEPV
jgi:HAD superfamily hydrolase (TIGR01509 family)